LRYPFDESFTVHSDYAASLKLPLQELQSRLKPESKREKKIDIPRYNGRGAKTKEAKPMDGDLKIAALRRKLIEAYNASGLSVPQFISAYENGVAVPELRERLGKRATYTRPRIFTKTGLPNTNATDWRGLPRSTRNAKAAPARHWTIKPKK
jgi:hypothetical protein